MNMNMGDEERLLPEKHCCGDVMAIKFEYSLYNDACFKVLVCNHCGAMDRNVGKSD